MILLLVTCAYAAVAALTTAKIHKNAHVTWGIAAGAGTAWPVVFIVEMTENVVGPMIWRNK